MKRSLRFHASITILPNVDVYACRRVQDSKVGNAIVNRLADLWVYNIAKFDRSALIGAYERLLWCSVANAFCCAENMILEANSLGISSCIIARGKEPSPKPLREGRNKIIE